MSKENLTEKLSVDKILSGKKVNDADEVMKDVTPISWSEKVLNGDYAGKTIIKDCDNKLTEEKSLKKVYTNNN